MTLLLPVARSLDFLMHRRLRLSCFPSTLCNQVLEDSILQDWVISRSRRAVWERARLVSYSIRAACHVPPWDGIYSRTFKVVKPVEGAVNLVHFHPLFLQSHVVYPPSSMCASGVWQMRGGHQSQSTRPSPMRSSSGMVLLKHPLF